MHTSMIKTRMVLIVNMIAVVLVGYVYGAPDPYLVKDIYPEVNDLDMKYVTEANGKIYFKLSDYDDDYGTELWVSDGTASGTMLVKYYYPYPKSLDGLSEIIGYNGKIYFQGYDIMHGMELWVSNDTASGTRMVKDIRPGVYGSYPSELTEYNGKLYFRADDELLGSELWVSDGTKEGTMIVKDPGGGSYPFNLTVADGKLFFFANDGSHGQELWVGDGTEEGTMMVKDINPGSDGSWWWYDEDNLIAGDGKLYFWAVDGSHGIELWVSDGTEEGTTMVKDINPSGSGCRFTTQDNSTVCDGKLYFVGDDGSHGPELWVSDGTASGTMIVKDIYPGSGGSYPYHMTECNDKLYFGADDGTHVNELWISDGTEEGTTMVSYSGSHNYEPGELTECSGLLCFRNYEPLTGCELWTSEGMESGTTIVKDIYPGPGSSWPTDLTESDGKLYFTANDGSQGIELYALSFCGDGIIQPGEGCEQHSDCDVDCYCDTCLCISVDVDDDGVLYYEDNCPDEYNPEQTDTDGDGGGDVCDECPDDFDNDIEGDGICGDVDNCPDISNPEQENVDGDGYGDACDEDDDDDGIMDDDDNCRLVANPDQADADNEGIGDVCDEYPYFPYFLPMVDGHYVRRDECWIWVISECREWRVWGWSTHNAIIMGYEYSSPPYNFYFSIGAMEFSLASAEGVFTNGLISAELSLTVKNGIVNSSCQALYDVADDFENGVLGEYENPYDYDGGRGDFIEKVCTDLQPGTIITFDVTASLEHDLFAPDQSGFAGFVLYPSGFPAEQYIEFYDHTDVENGPRLTIINKDPDEDSIRSEEDNCPDAYNPDQVDIDGDCMGDACDPGPNDPDNPVAMVDPDSDGIADACDNCPVASNHDQEDTYPPVGNGIGDACDCEGDFACDGDVDGSDASTFKADFGRSVIVQPCIVGDTCNGDFSCDGDVDGTDASLFKQDFGRSSMQSPCPGCVSSGNWCAYP